MSWIVTQRSQTGEVQYIIANYATTVTSGLSEGIDVLLSSITTNPTVANAATVPGLSPSSSGIGVGAVCDLVAAANNGPITGITVTTPGSNYAIGDTITFSEAALQLTPFGVGTTGDLVITLKAGDLTLAAGQTNILNVSGYTQGTISAVTALPAATDTVTINGSNDGINFFPISPHKIFNPNSNYVSWSVPVKFIQVDFEGESSNIFLMASAGGSGQLDSGSGGSATAALPFFSIQFNDLGFFGGATGAFYDPLTPTPSTGGQIKLASGTNALPAISFSDVDDISIPPYTAPIGPFVTGIYRPDTGIIGFSSNGALTAQINDTNFLSLVGGSAAIPSYNFGISAVSPEFSTGMYQVAADTIGFSCTALPIAQIHRTNFLSLVGGSATNPSYNFGLATTDFSTGMYQVATATIGFATDGLKAQIDDTTFLSLVVGDVGHPSYNFLTDFTTGMYHNGASTIGFATDGVLTAQIHNTNFLSLVAGSAGNPSYNFGISAVPEFSTGMYQVAAETIGFSCIALPIAQIQKTNFLSLVAGSATNPSYNFGLAIFLSQASNALRPSVTTGFAGANATTTVTGLSQSSTTGIGTGVVFTLITNGAGDINSGTGTVTVTSSGSNYVAGDTITFSQIDLAATAFGGGTSGPLVITLVDGDFSAATDFDTGMYSHGANSIGFSATGALEATISTANHLSLVAGLEATPSYNFIGDEDTGMYRFGANSIGFTANGLEATISTFHISAHVGTAANPSYNFIDDTNTGMYRHEADTIGFAANDTLTATIHKDNHLSLVIGSADTPSYNFGLASADYNTGMYQNGEDIIGFSTGGVQRVQIDINNVNALAGSAAIPSYNFGLAYFLSQATNALRPSVTIGITGADATTTVTGLSQSATTGTGTGAVFTLITNGAGDINSGAGTVTVTSSGSNYVAGDTITFDQADLITAGLGAGTSGPLVITLVDGDFTPDFVTGMYSHGANSIGFSATGALEATISTANHISAHEGSMGHPSYNFLSDPTTGMFNHGAGEIGFSTNGVLEARLSATTHLSLVAGTPGAPSYNFGEASADTNTGMYRVQANTIGFSTGAEQKLTIVPSVGIIPIGMINGINVGTTGNIAGIQRLSATADNSWEDGHLGNSSQLVFTASDFVAITQVSTDTTNVASTTPNSVPVVSSVTETGLITIGQSTSLSAWGGGGGGGLGRPVLSNVPATTLSGQFITAHTTATAVTSLNTTAVVDDVSTGSANFAGGVTRGWIASTNTNGTGNLTWVAQKIIPKGFQIVPNEDTVKIITSLASIVGTSLRVTGQDIANITGGNVASDYISDGAGGFDTVDSNTNVPSTVGAVTIIGDGKTCINIVWEPGTDLTGAPLNGAIVTMQRV